MDGKSLRKVAAGALVGAGLLLVIALAGCRPASEGASAAKSVVLYTSVDERFARETLEAFEKQTGIHVDLLTDSEAGKTTGLLRRLVREAERPRCDVWWSSEVFGTIELARQGVFTPYRSPAAADVPAAWKDPQDLWTGVAARARVLAFHRGKVRREELPGTWLELGEPAWAARLAIANPEFGTTRGHVAALLATHGSEAFDKFLQGLHDAGARIADGNAHAVRLVASGAADVCLTDTDDVWVAQGRSEPIDLVYPRLTADGPIMWIPCSVALVRGGPNAVGGRKLIDFLVSAAAERALAESESRNVPVRPALREELGMSGPAPEPVDFNAVADALPEAMRKAGDILLK
ncbi:MAG: extracellular solute-binding protein [Phycisphaerae bacterium]|jgi:iron(III) transport system substrate-binding protein